MAKLFSFRFVLFVIFCLFSLAFINTAWVAEDAFITFRSVDNMLAGYGLSGILVSGFKSIRIRYGIYCLLLEILLLIRHIM